MFLCIRGFCSLVWELLFYKNEIVNNNNKKKKIVVEDDKRKDVLRFYLIVD